MVSGAPWRMPAPEAGLAPASQPSGQLGTGGKGLEDRDLVLGWWLVYLFIDFVFY